MKHTHDSWPIKKLLTCFHCTDDHDAVMIMVDDGLVGLCQHCCVGGVE
jgi:hypothetical protein